MDDRERLSNGLMIFMKKWSVLIITSIKEPALLRKKAPGTCGYERAENSVEKKVLLIS